jgi:1,4-alpha-glucan branching enzyme
MPGDNWQKFANLRALLGYMVAQPGKKMLFMGGEFAQWREWVHDASLDWYLLESPAHAGVQKWVRHLNHLYRSEPGLYEMDCEPGGFEWIDCGDAESSVVSLIRKPKSAASIVLAVCNFTPVPRHNYRLGTPRGGFWQEIANSDAGEYGGSNMGNLGGLEATPVPLHGRPYSMTVTLPPLSVSLFKSTR